MFFPNKHKILALKTILDAKDFAAEFVISPFAVVGSLCHHPDARAVCADVHDHLINVLHTHSSSLEASCVASVILSHASMFNLEEESSLYVTALCVLAWVRNTGVDKNPYGLFQKIVASSKNSNALEAVSLPYYERKDQFITLSKNSFTNSVVQGVSQHEVLRISRG
jgi:hypothetical protein